MVTIRQADRKDVHIINRLSHEIWNKTFLDFISQEQIDYMLDWMYHPHVLKEEISTGKIYYILEENNIPIGYMSIEINYPDVELLRIHKLYVQPEKHGNGYGRLLLNKAIEIAKETNCNKLHLNVNRGNKAVDFYKTFGFRIDKPEDIKIGGGFFMNDYIMIYDIPSK